MYETRRARPYWYLCAFGTLLAAAIVTYSQTRYAFSWDEGFHLLTAQLIKNGRRPYLDFFFPQTPLNAYWNAFWMKLFGDTWHTAHAAAGVCTGAAIMLTIDFVYTRFLIPGWQAAGAFLAAVLVGLNATVVEFGVVGQAYGLGLFLMVAAFRLALIAVRTGNLLLAALTGCVAGAAAASTLLTAPILPVLLIWIAFYSIAGNRWTKVAAFLIGSTVPFLPIVMLALQNFRVVLFNVFEYHAFHRQEEWDGAIQHDLEIMSNWVDHGQSLLLIVFGIAGLWYIRKKSGWERSRKGEFYLCAWIVVATTAHLLNAHPTFSRYWLFTVPFLGSLAVPGIYALVWKLSDGMPRPFWPICLVTILVCLGEARNLYGQRDNTNWNDEQQLAAKVGSITVPGALVLGSEHIYFLTKRPPPEGLEHADSHKLKQSPEFSKQLHIISQADMDKQIQSGKFDIVENCDDDEKRQSLTLPQLYKQTFDVADCRLYWDRAPQKAK